MENVESNREEEKCAVLDVVFKPLVFVTRSHYYSMAL